MKLSLGPGEFLEWGLKVNLDPGNSHLQDSLTHTHLVAVLEFPNITRSLSQDGVQDVRLKRMEIETCSFNWAIC